MYIVNKEKTQIINMNQMKALYTGSDGKSIKVDFGSGGGCQIAKYNTCEEAVEAIGLLSGAIGKTEVFFFPDDERVRERLKISEQRYHHVTGKKTKGHGGS